MQLLEINKDNYRGQADPFIFEDNGLYYIYTTGDDGIYAYRSDNLFDSWKFFGRVFTYNDVSDFWAPSVIKIDGKYYMYCSFEFYGDTPDEGGHRQTMFVSSSDSPLGPFTDAKQLLHPFSIDSHVVKNDDGLFIFYSSNVFDRERQGTCIFCDRLLDPETASGSPVPVIMPSIEEEIYRRDRYKTGVHWHTVEGAFYFREGDWQYVMYSGACYENEKYFVGYARAKTNETELTKIRFDKFPDENTYAPVLCSNEWEEGTGHHSLIKKDGQWYAIYHARNAFDDGLSGDRRTARICKLNVNDGKITAERYKDKI